jgi:hypothetical protein
MPSSVRLPIQRVHSVSDILPLVGLLDYDKSIMSDRFNLKTIHMLGDFGAVLSRDSQARVFGLDRTARGAHGLVTDEIAGSVEQTDNFAYSVELPFRGHLVGRSALRKVNVELAEHTTGISTEDQRYALAVAQAVHNTVNQQTQATKD